MNVFITGASSGIGAALAEEFARRGATLGLVARRRDALTSFAATLPVMAAPHRIYPLDVTDRPALIAAAGDFEGATGGADLVVANAGISIGVLTEYIEDLDAMREVFATNVLAMAGTFHPFIAPMRRRRRGTQQVVGAAGIGRRMWYGCITGTRDCGDQLRGRHRAAGHVRGGALGGQVDRCAAHTWHAEQRALDPAGARGAGHAVDAQRDRDGGGEGGEGAEDGAA